MGDSLLVSAGVGSDLAHVFALVRHANVADLDGGAVHVRGVLHEADPALERRLWVAGFEDGVQDGDVHPLPLFGLVDPGDLRGGARVQ